MLTANLHRRCTETVLRKHATDRSALIDQHHGQIFAAWFFYARLGNTNTQALHGVELGCSGRRKVNWHSEWINSTDHGKT